MIYLFTNTANQFVYLSLDEARQYYATPFTNYLVILTHEENSTTGNDLAQVANIVSESVRVTNPSNAAVVGLVERGYAVLKANTTWFDIPSDIIPNDIIYEP